MGRGGGQSGSGFTWGCKLILTFLPGTIVHVRVAGDHDDLDHEAVATLPDHVDHLSVADLHHVLSVDLGRTTETVKGFTVTDGHQRGKGGRKPYFYEEISHPEAGSPGNTALIHRLQVLQGGEGRGGGELLDGGLSWKTTNAAVTLLTATVREQEVWRLCFTPLTFGSPQHKAETFAVLLLQQHRLLLDYVVAGGGDAEIKSEPKTAETAAAYPRERANRRSETSPEHDHSDYFKESFLVLLYVRFYWLFQALVGVKGSLSVLGD